jgi:hypothetical protein
VVPSGMLCSNKRRETCHVFGRRFSMSLSHPPFYFSFLFSFFLSFSLLFSPCARQGGTCRMAGLLEGALVMTLRCFAFALLERRRGASPLLFAHCLLLIAVYIARRGAAHRLASHRIVSCRIALRAVASAFAGRLHLRCVRFSLLLGARLGWYRMA